MIEVKVKNINGPQKAAKATFIRRAEFLADFAYTQELMYEAIKQAIENLLGPHMMNHFQIDRIGSNQYGENISIRPIDDVGSYIYYGTEPHEIGEDGQFLVNTKEGFAARGPVRHPGTAPKAPEIDREVQLAKARVLALVRKR